MRRRVISGMGLVVGLGLLVLGWAVRRDPALDPRAVPGSSAPMNRASSPSAGTQMPPPATAQGRAIALIPMHRTEPAALPTDDGLPERVRRFDNKALRAQLADVRAMVRECHANTLPERTAGTLQLSFVVGVPDNPGAAGVVTEVKLEQISDALNHHELTECVRNAPYAVELGQLPEGVLGVRIHHQLIVADGDVRSDGIDYSFLREPDLSPTPD